jgi:hypothetical protein
VGENTKLISNNASGTKHIWELGLKSTLGFNNKLSTNAKNVDHQQKIHATTRGSKR